MKNIGNIKIYETLRIKNKQYHKELILKDDSNDNDFKGDRIGNLPINSGINPNCTISSCVIFNNKS